MNRQTARFSSNHSLSLKDIVDLIMLLEKLDTWDLPSSGHTLAILHLHKGSDL